MDGPQTDSGLVSVCIYSHTDCRKMKINEKTIPSDRKRNKNNNKRNIYDIKYRSINVITIKPQKEFLREFLDGGRASKKRDCLLFRTNAHQKCFDLSSLSHTHTHTHTTVLYSYMYTRTIKWIDLIV